MKEAFLFLEVGSNIVSISVVGGSGVLGRVGYVDDGTVVVCIALHIDFLKVGMSWGLIDSIGKSCAMRWEKRRRYTPQSCPLDCLGAVG